jgi:hypothetical protein
LLPTAIAVVALMAIAWSWGPTGISDFYFARQDLPILCAMAAAAALFPYLKLGPRWESELDLSPRLAWLGALLIVALGIAGHWLVMMDHDLSRDQAMATFAARQIAQGTLVTPVPEAWQPFGRAMLPLYFNGRVPPDHAWTSGYLPVNSAVQAVGATLAHRSIANPLLLVAGLVALWNVARRIWPARRDAAVVTVVLAATSAQLVANAMTSFAMVGHFALNMIWLALFLRGDRVGTAGALLVGALAAGLHQVHFHPMFAAPFLLWLAVRRAWSAAAVYALGYAAIALFWMRIYPHWLVEQAGAAAVERPPVSPARFIALRAGRLFEYSWMVWPFNLARFVAWQNVALVPLLVAALRVKPQGPFLPLVGACGIGLVFMVFQGQGFGYRYLSGTIGCFCLLAAYGWVRLVPVPGPGRAWAMLKAACGFTLLVTLPLQLAMIRSNVAPHATLYHAAMAADAEVVLVDPEGGLLAQDLVQNPPDFGARPKMMDLRLVPAERLETLCRTKTVARIDRRHFRAVGIRPGAPPAPARRALAERRIILDRLRCAPPLALRR